MAAATCSALVIKGTKDSGLGLIQDLIRVPKPGGQQYLVKVSHVAQNPTDVQAFDSGVFGEGSILGCDFVGTVEDIGSSTESDAKGVTIAGLVWGGEVKGLGALSQYTLADSKISFPVPESITPEQAATIPLASATAELALFSRHCLSIDKSAAGTPVLIWGGSSSVGNYAIQLAALHGMEVITTCSPKHFDFVRHLGAKHVFDYNDENVAQKIKEAVPGLKYVFDTIGNSSSSSIASQSLDRCGGQLCTVRPGKGNTENVPKWTRVTDVLVWTAFLKEHQYAHFRWPIIEEDHLLVAALFAKMPQLLRDGKIKPNNVKLFDGGLGSVTEGFQQYRDGKISGYKIVYSMW